MFERYSRSPGELDVSPHALFDDDDLDLDLDLLLGDPFEGIEPEELAGALEIGLSSLGPAGNPEELAAVLMAGQLSMLGKAGREALWQVAERAEPDHLRLLLLPLVDSEADRTRSRRFLYGLMDDDDPLRVCAGVTGFQYRRERRPLRRILGLREHPSPLVRASVVSYHRAVAEWECLPTIVEAAQDPAPEVRRASMLCVLDLGVVAISTEVRQALDRARGRFVKERAQALLNAEYIAADELIEVCEEARAYEADLGREIRWKDVEIEEREYGNEEVPTDAYVALAIRDPSDPRLIQRVHDLWLSGQHWSQYIAITTMTVLADRTFEAEILDMRESDDELLGPAAYLYKRLRDPAGALPELLDLLRAGTPDHKLFALETLGSMFASEVDQEIRAWLEKLTADEDELVCRFALLALTPEWERRFREVDLPALGPYWT